MLYRLAGDLLQLILFDDDRFNGQACLELDLVQRMEVRRIGDGNEQALATLDEGQDAMLGEQLVRDESDGVDVWLDSLEVQERNAELLGGGNGDLAGVSEAGGNEMRNQIGVVFLGCCDRRDHRSFIKQPVLNQAQGKALEGATLCA